VPFFGNGENEPFLKNPLAFAALTNEFGFLELDFLFLTRVARLVVDRALALPMMLFENERMDNIVREKFYYIN